MIRNDIQKLTEALLTTHAKEENEGRRGRKRRK
jgi:hypothetical protein